MWITPVIRIEGVANSLGSAFLVVSCVISFITQSGCSEQRMFANGEPLSNGKPVAESSDLIVTSPDFTIGESIAKTFTVEGDGISPAVEWSGAPAATRSYALSLWRKNFNPEAPNHTWVTSYWVLYNIPVDVKKLDQGENSIGVSGFTDRGHPGYEPLNSKFKGLNQYHLTVYALDKEFEFNTEKVSRKELIDAMKGSILAEGTINFCYDHVRRSNPPKKK